MFRDQPNTMSKDFVSCAVSLVQNDRILLEVLAHQQDHGIGKLLGAHVVNMGPAHFPEVK